MSLANRTIVAAAWNYIGTATRIVGQLAAQILLARMVGPDAFGLVALAILPIGISCLVVDLGLGSALVHQSNPTKDDIKAVWSRTTFTGLIVTAFLCIVAQPLSILLGNPQAESVIRWLSPTALMYGLTVVPLVMLRRQLDMKRIQFSQLGSYLIAYMGVGVISAWSGAGVWALVAAWLTFYTASFLLALKFSRLRLNLGFRFSVGNEQRIFARRILFTNLFNWGVENLDNLAVGRFFGAQALGLYSISYNLVRTPANHLVVSLQSALFPASARMQDNLANLQRGYLAVISAVSLLAIPVFLSMAAVADTLVLALFGAKWQNASGVLMPLALAMVCHVIMAVSGPILAGKGRPDIELRVQVCTGLIFCGLLLAAARASVLAVAWATLAVYIIRMIWLTYAALRELEIKPSMLGKALSGPILLGISVSTVIFFVDRMSDSLMAAPGRLLIDIIAAGIVMTGMLWFKPLIFCADELRGILLHVTSTHPFMQRFKIIRRISEC